MASSNHLTRMMNIRDNLEKELENETARRLALTEAGNPPPASYTVNGRSVDWTGYVTAMTKLIADYSDRIIAAGGDGGIPEASTRMW